MNVIGLGDFLNAKIKVCSRYSSTFDGLIFFFFKFSSFPFFERKASSTIEQRKCKIHEKPD